jgi:hypothetical protein
MAKYKFEQFKLEITNPTTEVKLVNDNIVDKNCSVEILLTTDTAKFGVQLDGFTYVDTWEDADIYAWVQLELQKYEV